MEVAEDRGHAGAAKRPRAKRAPPPSTWVVPPFAPPPATVGDAGSLEWRVARDKWKRKHAAASRRRWERRERLHAKWEKSQRGKPPAKRARAAPARGEKKKTDAAAVPDYPTFWTPFCRGMAARFWMPAGELSDARTGETAPTWFETRTLSLPAAAADGHERDQHEAARLACSGLKHAIVREAEKAIVAKEAGRVKKNAKLRTEGKPEILRRDGPPPEPERPTKCKVFFVKPCAEQRALPSKFMGGARYCHDRAVAAFNALAPTERLGVEQTELIRAARLDSGARYVETGEASPDGKKIKKKTQSDEDPWRSHAPAEFADLPYRLRKNVARGVIDKRNAWKAKKCNAGAELKFKARTGKEAQESFYIEQYQIDVKTDRETPGVSSLEPIFGTESDRSAFPGRTRLPERVEGDCRVAYNRVHDRWKFIVPVEIEHREPNPGSSGSIVAIDPGIRVFATCYDLWRRKVVEWGRRGGRARGAFRGTEPIEWLCRKTDRLQAREKREPGQMQREEIHRLANSIRERIRHLVDEFHHKLAIWLCENYEVVVLPKFGAKRIMQRKNLSRGQRRRAIGRRSCRKLAQLSHGRFREFLLHKAREYGTTVVVCDERDTSRTCTRCGRIKADLGASEVYACARCGSLHGRDAGAARNILMRCLALREHLILA